MSAPTGPPDVSADASADVLVVGMSTLVGAWALAHVLSTSGVAASADIGQQGMPATVWVTLPPAARRRHRAVALAAATGIDPASRRLSLRVRRGTSVRLSATRRGASSLSDRPTRCAPGPGLP
ncbi:MAG TPA: hypothetical protein VGE38_03260 [Nocardioides sp.]|uniref:hypothetical protein n=1 Tax=Nocardioides sp. TaxID=35761 RepID=UPI002ED7CF86